MLEYIGSMRINKCYLQWDIMAKKRNIIKDLKRMGLVPTTKQYNQIMTLGIWILVLGFICLSFYGMYKYPTPHIYHDYNVPANHYSVIAYVEECECGNDPSCYPLYWWEDKPKLDEKYRYYV
jgi:hypothetical protein